MDSELKLLDFNNKGILGNLLAAEEHLAQTDASEINDSWCYKKHLTLANLHHAQEAVIHLQSVNPALAEKYKSFRRELDKILDAPDLKKLRDLRNDFRVISGEKTVGKKCGVCQFDKSSNYRDGESDKKDLYISAVDNSHSNLGETKMGFNTANMTTVGVAAVGGLAGAAVDFVGTYVDANFLKSSAVVFGPNKGSTTLYEANDYKYGRLLLNVVGVIAGAAGYSYMRGSTIKNLSLGLVAGSASQLGTAARVAIWDKATTPYYAKQYARPMMAQRASAEAPYRTEAINGIRVD